MKKSKLKISNLARSAIVLALLGLPLSVWAFGISTFSNLRVEGDYRLE